MLSLFLIIDTTDVFADETKILSQSFSFETTTIIEFTNYSLEEIKAIKIWLDDSSFKSFKSENGWMSTASKDHILFVTSDPLKTNQTAKFGVRTERYNPFIQWEDFDKNKEVLELLEVMPAENILTIRDKSILTFVRDSMRAFMFQSAMAS